MNDCARMIGTSDRSNVQSKTVPAATIVIKNSDKNCIMTTILEAS